MYSLTEKSVPVIAGVEITTDEEGRFNLNALHKASGLGTSKAPSQWLRTQSAQSLIAELEKETVQICIVSAEGRNGGTFTHELLAVEYAGWISPAFRLKVNQTFIDFRTGKLAPVGRELSRMDILQLAIEAEHERMRLEGENQRLEQEKAGLEHQLFEDAPKVEFHDKVVAAPGAMSIAQAAKVLGTGRNRLLQLMRQIAWVTRYNEPYQEKIEAGYLDAKLGSWSHPDHGVQQSVTTLITGKGLAKLQKILSSRS
ncbi:TPA: DNA-binding protein [Salmonella enterica]|nr:DNA-binding protein [Salmonella enterica]